MILERHLRAGDHESVASPTWSDVERVLGSLDGGDAFLGNDQTEGVWVTGGPDRYMVWVQAFDPDGPGLVIDEAVDPAAGPGEVPIVSSNGEMNEYQRTQTVDQATAVRIARRYFLDGGLDAHSSWHHIVTA